MSRPSKKMKQRVNRKNRNRNRLAEQLIVEKLEARLLLATNVVLGDVDQFNGPADLTLDSSKVEYAINFSNNDPDLVINGVTFQHDRQAIPGASLVGPREVTPWQTTPNFGATADDTNLEQVMADIRWALATGESLQAHLDVTPGTNYRVEVLISGNHSENRNWDITFEGALAVDEINSLGVQPGASYANNRSTVWRYDFAGPADGTVDITMGGNNFGGTPNDGGDRNAIWQAITLHRTNDAPQIDLVNGDTLVYGGGAEVIDQGGDGNLIDDQANLDGGSLTVDITSGAEGADEVFIDNAGANGGAAQIALSGATVLFNGTGIGTHNNGGNPLTVDFNANATPTAITALLQSITYEDTGTAQVAAKLVEFTVDDGQGGAGSAQATILNPAVTGAEEAFVWDGDTNNDWTEPTNWDVGGSDPTLPPDANDTAIFNSLGLGESAVDVNGVQFVGAVRFEDSGYALNNGGLTILGGTATTGLLTQTAAVAGANIIDANIVGAGIDVIVDGGTLRLNDTANAIDGTSSLTVNSGGEVEAGASDASHALGNAALNLTGGTLTFVNPNLPTDLGGVTSGLELWLDGSDTSTLYQDLAGTISVTGDNQPVGLWQDKSPGITDIVGKPSYNAEQSVAGERPGWQSAGMGGSGTLHLNDDGATNDGMIINSPNNIFGNSAAEVQPYTIIVVDKYWGGVRGRTVMSGQGANWLMNKHGGQNRMYAQSGWVYQPNSTANVTTPAIGIVTANGADATYHLNGVDVTGVGGSGTHASGPGRLAFGTEGNCCGTEVSQSDIAEIIAYDRAITPAERVALEAYLNFKYTPGGGGTATVNLSGNEINVIGDSTIQFGDGIRGANSGDISLDTTNVLTVMGNGSGQVLDVLGTLTLNGDATIDTVDARMRIANQVVGGTQLNKTGDGTLTVVAAYDSSVLDGMTLDISAGVLEIEGLPGPQPELGNVTAGLELWLDANDASTVFQDTAGTTPSGSGDPVALWMDKSGGGHHATQPTAAEQPVWNATAVNGIGGIRFNPDTGTNDGMFIGDPARDGGIGADLEVEQPYTVIIVDQYYNAARLGRTVHSGAGRNWLIGKHGGQNRYYAEGWVYQPNQAATLNQPDIGVGTHEANNARYYLNSVDVSGIGGSTNQSGAPGHLAIMAEGNCCGGEASMADIAELLVYDHVLSGADRVAVENYLGAKYGVFDAIGEANLSAMALVVSGDATVLVANNVPSAQLGDLTINNNVTLTTAGAGQIITVTGATSVGAGSVFNPTTADLRLAGNITGDEITKEGDGTLIIAGASSHTGVTTINAGTLTVEGPNGTLGAGDGTPATGTDLNAGELRLESGAIIGDELLTAFSTLSSSGDNTWGGDILQMVPTSIRSDDGTLTIDGDIDKPYTLTVEGDGDVVVNGVISTGVASVPTDLGAIDGLTTGDYTFFAGGQFFDARVDNDGTDTWLLVGRGRNGWVFDTDGPGGDIADVNQNLGTPVAFTPTAYSDVMINTLINSAGLDLSDVEMRIRRAADTAGNSYQEARWVSTSHSSWTWDFDDSGMLVDYDILNGPGTPFSADSASTRDNCCAAVPNNADNGPQRIFTWPWGGHGNQRGFSYGASVAGVDNNDPNTFLWEAGGENHAIPYTEVYIRATSPSQAATPLVKEGTGTLTLNGNNTYTDETQVRSGTLVVTSATALGTTDSGTTVSNGATLGLAGDVTLSAEPLTVSGDGAPGRPGALVGISGHNTYAGAATIVGSSFTVGSIDDPGTGFVDSLTLNNNVDLGIANLVVGGDGDTNISGVISGSGAVLPPATLDTLNGYIGNHSTTADGETFDVFIDNDGTNSWLLVGRGRSGWSFTPSGPGGDPSAVNDDLGTSAAFSPAALTDTMLNDLITSSGIDMTNIEIRLKRAGDTSGTGEYQEVRWRNFNRPTWTWDFDDNAYNVEMEILNNVLNGPRLFNGNTRDLSAGNDGTRVFTWPWGGHGSQAGFSYGASIGGVDGNNPNTFLWESGTENHAIPYTEVYIRSRNAPAGTPLGAPNEVIKNGSGTLTLSADNQYAGPTHVNAGTIAASHPSALGTTDFGTNVNDGGTLAVTGGITLADESLSLNGTGAAGQPGALIGMNGNNTVAPSVQVTAASGSTEIGIGSRGAGNLLTS